MATAAGRGAGSVRMPTALRRPRFRPQKERRRAPGCDPGEDSASGGRRPGGTWVVGVSGRGGARPSAFRRTNRGSGPACPPLSSPHSGRSVRGRGVRGAGACAGPERARRRRWGCGLGPQGWTAVSRRGPGQGGGGLRTMEDRAQEKAAGWPDPGRESLRAPRTPHGSRSPARGRPARSRSPTGQCCGSGPHQSSAFPDPWQTALMGVGHRLSQEGTFLGQDGAPSLPAGAGQGPAGPEAGQSGPPRSTGSLARLALTHSGVQRDTHFLPERDEQFYSFDEKRQRERKHKQGEKERQREKQASCEAGSPMRGSMKDPGIMT
ncbi:translation initiation factor IF-2 [Mustela lutreola]|uniref:translation initiation factor IF-2 n=1 Tax=Mustela lutreola TaxID=9666 RepID=UPI002797A68A|nr:translation initiation factor IF-2 [Mustela lutreola]